MQQYVCSNQAADPTDPTAKLGTSGRIETEIDRISTERLLAIADLIANGNTLPDLFKNLVPLLRDLANCDVVRFARYDAAEDRIVIDCWRKGEDEGVERRLSVEESPCGWVWRHQTPMMIPDLERETRFAEGLRALRDLGVHSYTVLPMSTPKGRYGSVGFGGKAIAAEGSRELLSLTRAARLVGLAVENHDVHEQWLKQKSRLQSLIGMSRELSETLELEELIPLVLQKMRGMTHYDFGQLALLEADGRALRIRGVDSEPGPAVEVRDGPKIPLGGSLSAEAIEARQIIFHEAREIRRSGNPEVQQILGAGVRALCCLPLLVGDRAVGTLVLGKVQEKAFRQEDREYLQQVGRQIAAAIHNATSYREIAQVKERLMQEKRYLENEIRGEEKLEEIVGSSPALKRVLDYAAVVAHTAATVLITGETGTGKERIARAIHLMSPRKERSFIKLNCAAIPTGLLESELFGHEKGAFTGAVTQKVGRLELADKGTLLLDEVGEIPLELQPKLLRVLQDQEFERLGGTKTIRVDVRLIAASNRDLIRAVEERDFRSDLFYRLHVFPLHLPALRERREDIPLLVRHFVEKCAARMHKTIEFIPDEAVEAMMNWSWPGNIRELENFIERSVILSEGNRLQAPLAELRQEAVKHPADVELTLRERERDYIVEILRQTRGVLSGPTGAASRLGLKRTTLQYKIQKLGITRSDYLS